MDLFGQHLSLIELAGALITAIAIWLTMKESIWCFPVGIISSSIYAYIFFSSSVRLYSDAVLQLFYVLLLVYGWIHWSSGEKKTGILAVTRFSARQRIFISGVIVIISLLIGGLVKKYTDANLAYLDAFTACLSLAAQWMVARKKIENWMIWIVANVIYVFMYVQKELFITAILYFILLILALAGLKEWKKHVAGPTS